MNASLKRLVGGIVLATAGLTAQASSHREALAILNEPCADNTDTYGSSDQPISDLVEMD